MGEKEEKEEEEQEETEEHTDRGNKGIADNETIVGVNNGLITMLLEIIIDRTSPVYTPEYFVLEKKKLWAQDIHTTSRGERTIALTIPKKTYYERIFKTVSWSTKSTGKGYYGMDYYIKPRLPSPTPSGGTLSGGENWFREKGRTERLARLENTANSKKVTKAAVMKQLSTFSCDPSNCNSGKLIPIPEDDSLVWKKRTLRSAMSPSSSYVMAQNLDTEISMLGPAHQHEADNHANFLEISTYLWQVLRILVNDDQTKCIRIQYTGTYIYYTEPDCKTNNCAKYIKSGEYFCKPQPYKTNYIALYRDVSGEDQITNFLYGLDRNAGRSGLNNATIEISEDSKIGDAIYDEWDDEDEEPGEVDSGDAQLNNVDDIKRKMAEYQTANNLKKAAAQKAEAQKAAAAAVKAAAVKAAVKAGLAAAAVKAAAVKAAVKAGLAAAAAKDFTKKKQRLDKSIELSIWRKEEDDDSKEEEESTGAQPPPSLTAAAAARSSSSGKSSSGKSSSGKSLHKKEATSR